MEGDFSLPKPSLREGDENVTSILDACLHSAALIRMVYFRHCTFSKSYLIEKCHNYAYFETPLSCLLFTDRIMITVGLESTTFRFLAWCSTDLPTRALIKAVLLKWSLHIHALPILTYTLVWFREWWDRTYCVLQVHALYCDTYLNISILN